MTIVTHLTILDQSQGNVLGARLQGKLAESDLRSLGTELQDRSSQHGRLRVLLELKSIKNFTPSELWEAMRTATPEVQEVERLALVCDDEDFRRWLAALSTSLLDGEVRYFEPAELRSAWEWVKEDTGSLEGPEDTTP